MQPQKLTMKNFGPFIEETVDFRVFDGQGLFLISGKTGAGKTTIFDAMTYALFGQTSGKLRSPKEMRSSFAVDNAATEVSFTFEHGGFAYEITRRPEQVLTRTRGAGLAKKAAKTSLVIFDDRGQEKEQLTKGVDKYIQDLLHLTADQFFKIIMLPQGEFRNFLVASSLEKEQVLRQLFDTQLYQDVTDWLKAQTAAGADALDALSVKAATVAEHFQWQIPQEATAWGELPGLWQVDLGVLQEKIVQLETAVASAQAAEKVAEEAFYQGKELQAAFDEQAKLAVQAKELAQQAPAIAANKKQIARLTWVQANQHLLREQDQSWVALADCEKQVTATEEQLKSLATKRKAWEAEKTVLATVETTLVQQRKELTQKELLLPVAQQYEGLLTELHAITQNVAQLAEEQTALTKQKAHLDKEQAKLTTILEGEPALQKQQLQLAKLAPNKERLLQLNLKQAELKQKIAELNAAEKKQRKKAQTLATEAEATKEEMLQVKSQQASLMIAKLAQDLLPGEPCPVCGSREHPAHQIGEIPTVDFAENEARLTHLETSWQTKSQASALAAREAEHLWSESAELSTQQEQEVKEGQQLLEQFGKALENFTQEQPQDVKTSLSLYERLQEKAVEDLEEIATARQQLVELSVATAELTTKQEQLAQRNQTAQAQENRLTGEAASLKRQLAGIAFEKLQEELQALQTEIQKNEQRVQDFATQGAELQESHAALSATWAQQKAQRASAQATAEAAKNAFANCLAKSPDAIAEEGFRALVAALPQLATLQEASRSYEQQVDYVTRSQEELAQHLAEKVPPDLAALSLQQTDAQEQTTKFRNQLATCLAQKESNEQIQAQLSQLIKENEALVARQSELTQLTDTISGKNRYKTSLERYILQKYLQEVLVVANERLLRLTKGRYQFQLAEKETGGRGQKGLDVDIYDDNSGQTRRVQTLSGGESFIAALALALSLADVIQNRAGGIPIEALFIDEGFGSLDEESLEMALEALSMIETEGRLIGIISHVQELKERISRKLLVKAQGTGQSRIELQA